MKINKPKKAEKKRSKSQIAAYKIFNVYKCL